MDNGTLFHKFKLIYFSKLLNLSKFEQTFCRFFHLFDLTNLVMALRSCGYVCYITNIRFFQMTHMRLSIKSTDVDVMSTRETYIQLFSLNFKLNLLFPPVWFSQNPRFLSSVFCRILATFLLRNYCLFFFGFRITLTLLKEF